jgi:hypothetical protein
MREQRHRKGPRVALVSGFWGQNIGNAFFNIGGKWILENVFPPDEVAFIQDQPGYRTFNNQSRGNPPNDFGLLRHIDVDYIVLQGPMLTQTFRYLWESTFRELRARGTQIILLSAAFFRYTREEIDAVRPFLREVRPVIISTRDHDSYELLRGYSDYLYDGIDSAFFVPDAFRPFPFATNPYLVLNFDRYPEPTIFVEPEGCERPGDWDWTFDALGHRWYLRMPRLPRALSAAGKWQAYLGAMLDRRRLPRSLAGLDVIRTEHRFNPHITWKIYRQPNALASDEPFTYFTVYSGASLTLSDRVHACVATLAYGRSAMLFSPSPRASLFARLGLGDIRNRPVALDPDRLEVEKGNQLRFLRGAVGLLPARG